MKKKILNVINDLDYGGAEKILSKIVNKNLNYDTYIISLNNNVPMIDNELYRYRHKIFILRFDNKLSLPYNIFKILKIIKKINPDIIVCWMYASCIISIFFRMVIKKTVIIWNIRQSLNDLGAIKMISRIVIKATCFFSSYPDITIFNSKKALLQHSRFGFDQHKSFYLPNGVDIIDDKITKFNNDDLKIKLNLKKDYKIVGLIGNYKPWKDHKMMLKCINQILKVDKKIYFLLIGRDVDESNNKIINDTNFIKNHNNIKLLGFIEHKHILNYINLFDIYCSTSTNEGFSNTLLEALSLNKICICSNVGDAEEILAPLKTLYDSGDYNKLSSLLLSALDNLDDYKQTFEKESDKIINQFSTTRMFEEYKLLLENVLIDTNNA